MKKYLVLLFIIAFVSYTVNSQAQQVIASAGGYYEGDNISLTWTLGETVIETFTGNDVILTQGFQQPYSFYLSQIINIPAGWSGVSGYIDPMNKGVVNIFDDYIPDFIILSSMSEFYYPEGNVNTIGNWNYETGYKIKATNEFDLTLTGIKIDDPTVLMAEGWNLIPVMTSCGAVTDEIFSDMAGLTIVKEVAGTKIYWPEFGIETLDELQPGNAYMVRMGDDGDFTYPECTKATNIVKHHEKPLNYTAWNDLNYTQASHAIAFPYEVLISAGLQPGDVIGVFTPEGLCAGRVEITNLTSNVAVVAFASDETTMEKDGFADGEMLQFKVYKPDGDEEVNFDVEYNPALPNLGVFVNQGLSAVKSGILIPSSVYEQTNIISEVYPNPSHGIFTLTMNRWPEKLEVQIMDTRGRLIEIVKPGEKLNGSSLQLKLNNLPNGVYFLRLVNDEFIGMKKIIIN